MCKLEILQYVIIIIHDIDERKRKILHVQVPDLKLPQKNFTAQSSTGQIGQCCFVKTWGQV